VNSAWVGLYNKCGNMHGATVKTYLGCSFSPWPYVILLHFSRNGSKRSSPSFFSTTLHNFQGTSGLLSEVYMFQHQTKLRSKPSISLVSSLNESRISLHIYPKKKNIFNESYGDNWNTNFWIWGHLLQVN